MFNRASLLCITLSFLAATMPVQAQQEPFRFLRIFVEGEPSFSLSIIEALRRNSAKYDLRFEFAGGYGDPYDLRLIASTGSGSTSCIGAGTSCSFSYLTIAALAPDGKLLFTVTQPDVLADGAAVQVIRNIYSHSVMPRKQPTPDLSGSQEASKPVVPTTAVKTMAQEPPADPGVYYKNNADWIRLTESPVDDVMTKGGGMFLLSFGASSVKIVYLYDGAAAELQVSTQQPEFYVRGFAISDRDVRILRLERKQDHRELQVSSLSPGRSKGIRPNDIYKVAVTRLSDGAYKIAPASELKPGEYILEVYRDNGGYAFGIVPLKN
jgi:hypothetical protein